MGAVITASVVAWGFLVYAAIDFGTLARDGDNMGWAFMALAALGAMACLFGGLMVFAALMRRLGIITDAEEADIPAPAPRTAGDAMIQPDESPRPAGGKRAAR